MHIPMYIYIWYIHIYILYVWYMYIEYCNHAYKKLPLNPPLNTKGDLCNIWLYTYIYIMYLTYYIEYNMYFDVKTKNYGFRRFQSICDRWQRLLSQCKAKMITGAAPTPWVSLWSVKTPGCFKWDASCRRITLPETNIAIRSTWKWMVGILHPGSLT